MFNDGSDASKTREASIFFVFRKPSRRIIYFLVLLFISSIYYGFLFFLKPHFSFYIFPIIIVLTIIYGIFVLIQAIFSWVALNVYAVLLLWFSFLFLLGLYLNIFDFFKKIVDSDESFSFSKQFLKSIGLKLCKNIWMTVSITIDTIKFFIFLIKRLTYATYEKFLTILYLVILVTSTLKVIEVSFGFTEFFINLQHQKAISESIEKYYNLFPSEIRNIIQVHVSEQTIKVFTDYLSLKSLGLILCFILAGACISILSDIKPESSNIGKLKNIWWTFFKLWGFIIPLVATFAGLILTIKAG